MASLTPGALVLEGGGMRGAFTAGVLDYLLDKDIMFDHIYGVSIGACHACSYISRQRGRAFRIVADYVNDPRYMGYRHLLKEGNMFATDFVYRRIPDELDPFDYETFRNYGGDFRVVMTDCDTGKPVYARVKDLKTDIDYVRASASLPGFSRIVHLPCGDCLDGGMVDSIPVKKAFADGSKKVVAVLTRDEDYVKSPSKAYRITRVLHPLHPKLNDSIKHRHEMYNETTGYITEKEASGELFVIRPEKADINIERLERNRDKLEALYEKGYAAAEKQGDRLMAYLEA